MQSTSLIRPLLSWPISFLCLATMVTSCGPLTLATREEKHKYEVTLQKLRADVEDLKHEMSAFEVEHQLLDSKLLDQEQTVCSIRDQTIETGEIKIEGLKKDIEYLKEGLAALKKRQQDLFSDVKELTQHAQETTTALTQYKSKIEHIEKHIAFQDQYLEKISEKATVSSISQPPFRKLKPYRIRSGDTLEKLAKIYQTSVDELKRINHLKSDLIVVGEEIIVPVTENGN